MREVLVSFEVSVSEPENSKPFKKVGRPNFVFEDQFDKDDDVSFNSMCELEFRVQHLVKAFVDLGFEVSAIRKEMSHLEI